MFSGRDFLLCSSLVDKYLENFLERLERAYFTYTQRDLFRRIMVQTCSFSPLLDEGEKGCKLMTSQKKRGLFPRSDIIHFTPKKGGQFVPSKVKTNVTQAKEKGPSISSGPLQCCCHTKTDMCTKNAMGIIIFLGPFSREFSKALEWNAWNFICYATITRASSYNHQPETCLLHCTLTVPLLH